MPPMRKGDLFAAIRRDFRVGLSVRSLARKYQVSRRTVRSALSSAWPAARKSMPPPYLPAAIDGTNVALDLVEPGVVPQHPGRPDTESDLPAEVDVFCGMARKP